MTESFFIRGVLIGLIFGVPAGAIGIMTIQRTMEHGFAAGVVTGLGSVAADCLYGCIGVCGVTAVSGLLLDYQGVIRLAGGGLILLFGAATWRKREVEAAREKEEHRTLPLPLLFASSFLVAVMNPAAILAFLTAFAAFGILGGVSTEQGCQLLCGLALGTGGWWLALSGVVSIFRGRVTARLYGRLNRILGGLMMLFGLGTAAGAVIGFAL